MGDSAACDYAQTSHLSVGLQCGCFRQENNLSLYGRVPRDNFMAGIIIDDLIVLEKIALDATTGIRANESRQLMHDMYKQVGLDAHPTKGFADELFAEFWGASVDGFEGLIRANVARCISLVWVISRVAHIGLCSVGLLEVLAGGFVSVFGFRRRLMSPLDLIYVMQAGRERQDIIRLGEAAVDELWSLVILCPLAVTDLRTNFSDKVFMVDASNWGDAVTSADIAGGMRSEIHRHCATKSAWARLLSPFKAMQRGKGCLAVEDELPRGKQMYSEHPVWEVCARAFDYELVWKQKAATGRHVNKGELRSYLKAEALGGSDSGDVRVPIGSDSQVCISGAICKGRSASMCLNNPLKHSLGNVLCFGLYSNAGYIGSARVPADDPTRGVPLRKSDVEVPDWWKAAEGGDFKLLDSFLSSLELHPYQLAGYDDLSDISGNPFLAVDPGLKHGFNRYCKKIRNKIRLRAKIKKDATCYEDCEASSNFFSEDVLTCLESFGREQFIFQDGLSWPPQSQVFQICILERKDLLVRPYDMAPAGFSQLIFLMGLSVTCWTIQ